MTRQAFSFPEHLGSLLWPRQPRPLLCQLILSTLATLQGWFCLWVVQVFSLPL